MPNGSRPVALITGASRGIGRSIAIELARGGYDIAANATTYDPAQRQAGLAEVEDRITALGAAFEAVPGDISRLDVHETIVTAVLRRFGRIDLLVNNAGVGPQQRLDILDTTPAGYDRVMATNARGTFFLTQRVARCMVEQVQGERDAKPAIIFISSVSAVASSPNRAEYCLAKAAVSQAAHIFADRLAAHGVNVYEVRPGIIRTDMTAPVREMYDERIVGGLVPQGRWGEPEDVARVVAALASGAFAYATGIALEVSGGMNIRHL
jgi:3-oxoacyl-[acyl-carrier protein] reductase